MNFKEYLNESQDKVFVSGKELWVAYAEGSGTVSQYKGTYISSNKDSNFDINTSKISTWAEKEKPLKQNDNKKLFELLIFDVGKSPYNDKPKSTEYMVVTDEKSTVINFFKSKKEALAWLK